MRYASAMLLLALFGCSKTSDLDGDGYDQSVDCNDAEPTIHPDATEVCNGVDDDCSGAADDGVADAPSWYADADADGYGTPADPTTACEAPPGYVSNDLDCNDDDPRYNPSAIETECSDPNDYNCDGSAGGTDADGDGYSACNDCDDADPARNPGAVEVCDGEDQDCDGAVDEDAPDAPVWYLDVDGDGYGVDAVTTTSCDQPSGYAGTDGDCDDMSGDYHPGADEADCADPEDYNCDGSVGYSDADGDGFPACKDCDDANAKANPDEFEVCDGADNDCNGTVDDDAVDADKYYADSDKDGYGDVSSIEEACSAPSGYVANDEDCDDKTAAVHPFAIETCDDVDEDCDGAIDEDAADGTTWYADLDGDGAYGSTFTETACDAPSGYGASATDCDDLDAKTYPGASEVCDDVDNDCDGTADDSPTDATTWYADADGDMFGNASKSTSACDQPSGYVGNSSDCDDASSFTHPGALEFCDAADNDCDGTADDSAIDATAWYADADGDGYGDAKGTKKTSCTAPTGYVDNNKDCDDASKSVSPSAREFCNGIDDNCDGVTDGSDSADAKVYYADADGDGYGNPSSPTTSCSEPPNYTTDDSDCEDGSATAYPGSTETETPGDGIDQDCDGQDLCTDLDCDGLPDILLPAYYDGDYSADTYGYYTGGDGTFASADRWALAGYAQVNTAAEDIDGDGYQDIVTVSECGDASCSTYSTKNSIYWGSASGYSTSDRTQLSTVGAYGVCIGDIDADGYKDVVYASYYTGSSYSTTSYVFWGSAAGWSDSDRTSLSTTGAVKCEIADFDGDGDSDLLFLSHYDGDATTNSRVYYNVGGSLSTSSYSDLPTYEPYGDVVADFDGDGYLDVAISDYYDGDYYATSYVYYGSATGLSSSSRDSMNMYGALSIAGDDLNGDGYEDLVLGSYYDGDYYAASYVYWGSATGFSDSNRSEIDLYGVQGVEIADVDQDGYKDLLFAQYYDGDYYVSQYVYFGSKTGFSSSNTMYFNVYASEDVTVADFDHNGYNDIVYASHYDGDYLTQSPVFWGSSKGWSSSNVSYLGGNGDLSVLAVGK